jgi:hypothetical protein
MFSPSSSSSTNSLLAILRFGDLFWSCKSLMRLGKGEREFLGRRRESLGCRKVCPRGSNQEREQEMSSMVGLRGTVQIRHTRQWSMGLLPWKLAASRAQGCAGTVRPRYRHKWRDGAWIGRYLTRTPFSMGNKIALQLLMKTYFYLQQQFFQQQSRASRLGFSSRNALRIRAIHSVSSHYHYCRHGSKFTQ